MMAVIGWVTISVLFVAAGLFIYETAMLLAQAKENDQVICEWRKTPKRLTRWCVKPRFDIHTRRSERFGCVFKRSQGDETC
jgi:hypothetical protein